MNRFTAFLASDDGIAWVEENAQALIEGHALEIGTRKVLTQFDLADLLLERTTEAFDPDRNFSMLLFHVATGEGEKAKANLEAFMGRDCVEKLAREMVAGSAGEYLDFNEMRGEG